MRITRLALRHYRGVEERVVELAPRGVTLVCGPNEVGKSSLAEAVELLFEELDNTAKRGVREIRPVDRDEGSEVEADVELGPWAFTYTKRFHRRPATRLVIRRPRAETLTGREAHERVRALLDEHVDVALWRALRWVQGAALEAPELDGSTRLAAALDRAAGVRGGGEREESLFEAVRSAYETWFTPTGRPRRETMAAEAAFEEARREEGEHRARLDALQRDVEAHETLLREVAALEERLARERAEVAELEGELESIETLRREAGRLGTLHDAARAEESAAVQEARQRGQLVSAYAGACAELESLAEVLESEEPAYVAASAGLRHVEDRLAAARVARDEADAAEQRARADASLRRAERELQELDERLARAAREAEDVARAREVLSGPPLEEARVSEIQSAQLEVERAQTRLDTEGPRVALTPEVDLEWVLDGRRERLRAGETVERSVAEALLLALPGVAEVTVVAGAGVAEQRKALEQARTRLRTLCVEAGVEDHAGAVAALAAQRGAREELARGEERLGQALGSESAASLAARREDLERRVARERAQREVEAPGADALEAAERVLEEAQGRAAQARREVEHLTRRREEAAERFARQDQERSNTRTRLELAEQHRADFARRLFEARSEVEDDVLEARRRERGDAARELETQTREAERALARREPERSEARARARRDAIDAGERALRERRETRVRTAERLEVAGREGLFERWSEAERRRLAAERSLAGMRRRAAAAGRLFEVLREERDAARSQYAAPLAEQVASLGRGLFGADFAVELGDDLRVTHRVQDGLRLATSQLSAGAREQLGLLVRLAASRLAGGVPLWLDDALGHSDPARLEALGPLLARAGEDAQVIVLTCAPERFRSVPDARVVEL